MGLNKFLNYAKASIQPGWLGRNAMDGERIEAKLRFLFKLSSLMMAMQEKFTPRFLDGYNVILEETMCELSQYVKSKER